MADTFTYANNLPTDRDWLRWRLDDVGKILNEVGDPIWLRANEELDAVLIQYPADRRLAAAELAESMAAEQAKRVDSFTDEDGNSARWSTRVSALLAIAKSLRAQIAGDADIASGELAFGQSRARRFGDDPIGEYVSRPAFE